MLSIILPALMVMQAAQPAQSQPQHRVENVRDNIYCVFGPGGNVGVIVGDEFIVMIDGQFEHSLPGLLEAVKSISDKPIKYLINTHHHRDHTDANRILAQHVQAIIAHINVRTRIAESQKDAPEAKKDGLPTITFGEANPAKPGMLTLVVGDSEVHLAHFNAAHTDNDVAVGIPASKVMHMGDKLFMDMLPFIDTEAGGSFDGLVQVIGSMLAWLPDDSLIIPGHGPVCDKAELSRHHAFLLAIQQHVRKNATMTPAELADSFDKTPWEDKRPTPQFVTWETLFQAASGKGSGRVKQK